MVTLPSASFLIADKYSHMALVLGRPRHINANDCNVRVPIDCRIPEDPSVVVPTAADQGGDSPPSTISPSLFQYAISQMTHEMYVYPPVHFPLTECLMICVHSEFFPLQMSQKLKEI